MADCQGSEPAYLHSQRLVSALDMGSANGLRVPTTRRLDRVDDLAGRIAALFVVMGINFDERGEIDPLPQDRGHSGSVRLESIGGLREPATRRQVEIVGEDRGMRGVQITVVE